MLALLDCRPALATENADWTPLPVTVNVGHLGSPAPLGDGLALAYEIRLTNDFRRAVRLEKLEVLGPGGDELLAVYEGAALSALRATQATTPASPAAEQLELQPSEAALLHLFVRRTSTRAWPAALRHRLHWSWLRPDGTERQRATMIFPARQTAAARAPVLDSPLRGGVWLAANGPANESEHRRTIAYADGVATLPQRYAYDLVQINEDGRLFRNDGSKPEDWFGFGQALLAAADGVVVLAEDGAEDNSPVGTIPPTVMNVRSLCGNTVSLRIASGHHLIYCHLQKASVAVRPGQVVKRGSLLGRLGNSGNSDAPHLHLHLSTQAHPMRGEGEPVAFACHRPMGKIASLEAAFSSGRVSTTPGKWTQGQAVAMNELIELPAGPCP